MTMTFSDTDPHAHDTEANDSDDLGRSVTHRRASARISASRSLAELATRPAHRAIPWAVLLATVLVTLIPAPSGAIIGGEFDGNRHPYIGAAIGPGLNLCSGAAISPTLFVTAAHCFDNEPGERVFVSFDADLFGDRDGDPVPHFVRGTFYPDPRFCIRCGPAPTAFPGFLSHDSGVVVLDEPVALERYAQLPSEGLIETLAKNTRVDIVGYGLTAPPKYFDWATDTIPRMMAEAELNPGDATLGDDWVKLSATPGEGKGRVCFDDSGGPALLGDTILATTSMVLNDLCIGLSYSYRLDTADALTFIGQFANQ